MTPLEPLSFWERKWPSRDGALPGAGTEARSSTLSSGGGRTAEADIDDDKEAGEAAAEDGERRAGGSRTGAAASICDGDRPRFRDDEEDDDRVRVPRGWWWWWALPFVSNGGGENGGGDIDAKSSELLVGLGIKATPFARADKGLWMRLWEGVGMPPAPVMAAVGEISGLRSEWEKCDESDADRERLDEPCDARAAARSDGDGGTKRSESESV